MATKVFDTRLNSVSVDGKILADYADGTPVHWAHSQPNSQSFVPSMGNPYRVIKNAPLGTVTVRVLPDTATFQFLMEIANSQREVPIVVNGTGERVSGNFATINQFPAGNISDADQVREFVFEVLDYKDEALTA